MSEPLKASWSPGSRPEEAYCQIRHVRQPAGSVPGLLAYRATHRGSVPARLVVLAVQLAHQSLVV